MIDAILSNTVLPRISKEYLRGLVSNKPLNRIVMSVDKGDFAFQIE